MSFAATLYRGATLLTLADGANAPLSPGSSLVSDAGSIAAVGPGDGANDSTVTSARAEKTSRRSISPDAS